MGTDLMVVTIQIIMVANMATIGIYHDNLCTLKINNELLLITL